MNPIVAHRGWSGKAPENTMAAFFLALGEPSVSWMELDVQMSKDGVPVVIHDFKLNRTTNGKGYVRDQTFSELRKLDAGAWYGDAFKGEKVPSLSEVLQACVGRCRLNIEIKTARNMYPGIEAKVAELVHQYQMQYDVVITSFDHESVKKMREAAPNLRTGLIISGKPVLIREQLKETGATLLSMDYHYLAYDFVNEMIGEGYMMMAWTVNDKKSIDRVAAMHRELMICTNYPDRAIEAVAHRNNNLFF